mgnify:CR=1 FL=1
MIIKNQKFDDYLKIKAISQSSLKNILKTPAYFKAVMDGRIKYDSESMSFGKLAHAAVFFPDTWQELVKVYDGIKRGKAWEEFKAALNGAIAVKPDEQEKVVEFLSIYKENTFMRQFIDGGEYEMTLTGEIDGVKIKGMVDCYQKNGTIVDLKTTKDASYNEFSKSILKYGYHIQAACYMELAEQNHLDTHSFIFCAVESDYPYSSAVYQLRPEDIALGHSQLLKAVRIYKKCTETNKWEGYPEELKEIGIPSWGI